MKISEPLSKNLRDSVVYYLVAKRNLTSATAVNAEERMHSLFNAEIQVSDAVLKAIIRTVSGLPSCSGPGRRYYFHYGDKDVVLKKNKECSDEEISLGKEPEDADDDEGEEENNTEEQDRKAERGEGEDENNLKLPERISRFRIEDPSQSKEASEAIKALWIYIKSKVFKGHPDTLKALQGNQEDQVKWIKKSLGFVINNKLFGEENKAEKSCKESGRKKLDEEFSGCVFQSKKDVANKLSGILEIDWEAELEHFDEDSVVKWASAITSAKKLGRGSNGLKVDKKFISLYLKKYLPPVRAQEIDNAIAESTEIVRTDSDPTEWESGWIDSYFGGIAQAVSDEELIKWQYSALFWENGEKKEFFIPEDRKPYIEFDESSPPVCSGFFYYWLRLLSGATVTQIACELTIPPNTIPADTTISRDWRPKADCRRKPFPIPKGNAKKCWPYLPIYLEHKAKLAFSLYVNQIRHDPEGHVNRQAAKRAKEGLWNIYDLVRDDETMEYLLESRSGVAIPDAKRGLTFVLRKSTATKSHSGHFYLCVLSAA